MNVANILAAAAGSIWGLILLTGITLYRNVLAQHVVGFPNAGQAHYYIVFPSAVLAVLLLAMIIANRLKRGAIPLITVAFLAGSIIPPYMMAFTGGV